MRHGPRVLSLYEGFFAGGARILHTSVIRALDATTSQRHGVLALTDRVAREFTVQAMPDDTSYRRLVGAGIPVHALAREASDPLSVAHLATLERAVRSSDAVLSLKEQPLAALTAVGTAGRPLLTALHRSDPEHQGPGLDALFSLHDQGLLTAAICCSHATQRAYHAATGIPLAQLPVIPNGVDLHRFSRDPVVRCAARQRLGVPDWAPVVLIAARFDEMKDIPLFVRAAGRFARERPDAHFVLCGAGMSLDNPALVDLLARHLHQDRVHAMGIQSRMAPLYNAADLVVLTSAFGEAAPLCLLEGMATGAVPVTTDVGDAALIVGDPRLVVPHEADAVAAGWLAAYAARKEHRKRVHGQRQRLNEQHCVDAYARLVDSVVPVTV